MPTSPPEILELARHIRQTFLTEAGRRSAVSRAYYAAMHQTKHVFGLPVDEEDESSHRAVIRAALERAKSPGPAREEASKIAQALDVLRRRRNRADYALTIDLDKMEADDCIARADRLIELCDQAKEKHDAVEAKANPPALSNGQPEPLSPTPKGPRPSLKRIK